MGATERAPALPYFYGAQSGQFAFCRIEDDEELPEDAGGESIEERILMLPKPRVNGDRVSVLDRLYLKQAEHAIRSGRPEPKFIRDMVNERDRK